MTKKGARATGSEQGRLRREIAAAGMILVLVVSAMACRVRQEQAVSEQRPKPRTSEIAPEPALLPRTELVPVVATQEPEDTESSEPHPMGSLLVLAMGGIGSPMDDPAPEVEAVERVLSILALGATPLDAVAAGVSAIEDSGLRNAGVGSSLRLDGITVEADAAVMDSTGRFGAVAAVPGLRHPVLAARAVAEMPVSVLAGDSATRLALRLGLEGPLPIPDAVAQEYRSAFSAAVDPAHRDAVPFYFEHFAKLDGWREPASTGSPTEPTTADSEPAPQTEKTSSESVTVLLRDEKGLFAGAMSSGGPVLSLPGRVGHIPIPGAAMFCGAKGIVAISGNSERVIAEQLARRVYEELARSGSASAAAALGSTLARNDDVAIAIIGDAGMLIHPQSAVAFASFSTGRITTSGEESAP
ncbi:MAG: isoaspartyl peptidase/L-asparaginase [Myxococcota bacterium]|nr:isoaspartyl peptidase/L-asparaginase [Myxococcota bacterium]